MKIDRKKILINASYGIAALIVILLLILGVQSSDFTKLQKYDIEGKTAPRLSISGNRASAASVLRNSMQVSISSDNQANLGDFVFNISGDRKLIANISMKYKSSGKRGSWFNDKNDMKEEILKKSVILRDSAINTMLGYSMVNANNEVMRKALQETLNKNLEYSEIEEVYFNQFIIQ
ncbi:flagellar basal body-associated FliL family protein [Sulfurimonas sp.]|uniref:flagellar basal body-associated FliL family protein n=1 Tax=Sulfurimonas sp. TaxID=2022749 RepID=UPI0025F7013E|nr:flagellar basal body-associated FliL family protein [Sulfurimonas sp.]MBW6489431.1 flagellar basal body-associated FliL family protein [Sulfurimonas sp.]